MSKNKLISTLVVMISVGNRDHLTQYSYKRLYEWASKHDYNCALIKQDINYLDRSPHFNKLIIHKKFPNFDKYIIIDDDLFMSKYAPAMEHVPKGFVGLCMDGEQGNTENTIVEWTANTGFIVADKEGMELLEIAYNEGIFPYNCNDGSKKGIWGPFDQGILNYILFQHKKVYQLDSRWNNQFIIEYYIKGKGWDYWVKNKFYRLSFYLKLFFVFSNQRKKLKNIYGLHLTMGIYPSFFNYIFK